MCCNSKFKKQTYALFSKHGSITRMLLTRAMHVKDTLKLTGDARLEFLRNSGPAPEKKMERAGQ